MLRSGEFAPISGVRSACNAMEGGQARCPVRETIRASMSACVTQHDIAAAQLRRASRMSAAKKPPHSHEQAMAATGAGYIASQSCNAMPVCESLCFFPSFGKRHAMPRQALMQPERMLSSHRMPAIATGSAVRACAGNDQVLPHSQNRSATRGWRFMRDASARKGGISRRSRCCPGCSSQPGSLPCELHRAT